MEGLRLTSIPSAILSVVLGFVPSLELLNSWAGAALNLASLVSVLIIIVLNLKKLRNAAPTS